MTMVPPADWEVPTYRRVDWEGTPVLEGQYITDMEYEYAPTHQKLIANVESERKELVPTYNHVLAHWKESVFGRQPLCRT